MARPLSNTVRKQDTATLFCGSYKHTPMRFGETIDHSSFLSFTSQDLFDQRPDINARLLPTAYFSFNSGEHILLL